MSTKDLLASIESSLADISENVELLSGVESALADIAEGKGQAAMIGAVNELARSLRMLKINAPTVNVTNQVNPTPIEFKPVITIHEQPKKAVFETVFERNPRGQIEKTITTRTF
jgi:hypothetical protein